MADHEDTTPDTDTGEEVEDVEAEQLLADAVNTTPDDGDDGDTDPDAKHLGDAGKRALDRMKQTNKTQAQELADLKAKLQKFEDQGKSESQRLQDDRDQHKTRAEKAEAALLRREIAEDLAPEHATIAQIKAVAKRLSGDDDDALRADAEELFGLIAPAPPKAKTPGKPQERLRGGADPDTPAEETDPRKLAAQIPRGV